MLLLRKYLTKETPGNVERYGEKTADARLLSHCQNKVKVKGLCIVWGFFLNDYAHNLGIN